MLSLVWESFFSGDPDAAVVTRNTATKSDTKQLISVTKL